MHFSSALTAKSSEYIVRTCLPETSSAFVRNSSQKRTATTWPFLRRKRHESRVFALYEASVPLGSTPLRISHVGIGTLQWGDPASGFGSAYGRSTLSDAFTALMEGGINFFDSAEVYGYQGLKEGLSSEQLLGSFAASRKAEGKLAPVIATKFFTIPWTNLLIGGGVRLGRKSMILALKASLERLNLERVDLYQIHFPFPTFSNGALMEGLSEAKDLGLAAAVGVSNYSRSQMEEAHALLAAKGIPLASNHVKYSLLCRAPETDGLLQSCKDRNITLIAYSPLASGLLSEKALSRGDARTQKVQPLLEVMKRIGAAHGGRTVSQVALGYLVAKGAVPIPGCKTPQQAREHVEVLSLKLQPVEVDELDKVAALLRV